MPPQDNSRNTIIFVVIAAIMLMAYSYFVMQPQAERRKAAQQAAAEQTATAPTAGAPSSTPGAVVYTTDRTVALALDFPAFMAEVCKRLLPIDWERDLCQQVNTRRQGAKETFIDYATAVRSANSLLINTPSHVDDAHVRTILESSPGRYNAMCTGRASRAR